MKSGFSFIIPYTVMIDEIDHYNDNLHPSVQFCPQSIPELCC